MANNELAVYQGSNAVYTWQEMKEQASTLVPTGFLPEAIKTPQQALAIMLTGKELGLPPMQSLRGVHVIKGTPTIKPELMLALCVQRIKGFKYQFKDCDANSATFVCSRPELLEPYESTFTMDDAKRAGLTSNQSWSKYPGNMLRWRAVANALHVVAPDVLVGVYTPEEIGAEVDAEGEIVNTESATVPESVEDTTVAEPEPMATKEQIAAAHAVGAQKFGKGKPGKARYDKFRNDFFRREVHTNEITSVECSALIDALSDLPDYQEEAA